MNRELLESLGLEKDVVDKVMAEHGKSLQAAKADSATAQTEQEALKAQLEQRNNDLAALKKDSGTSTELQQKLTDLETKYDTETANLQKELEKTKTDSAIDLSLTKSQSRNNKAVRALIDLDKLVMTDSGLDGLDEQLDAIKSEAPYLFEDVSQENGKGSPNFVKGGNLNPPSDLSRQDKLKQALGITEAK